MECEGIPIYHHGDPLRQYANSCTSPTMLVNSDIIRQVKVLGPPNCYNSFLPISSQGMEFEGIPIYRHGDPLWQYANSHTFHMEPRMLVKSDLIRQAKVPRLSNYYSSFQTMPIVREWSLKAFRSITMETHYGSRYAKAHHRVGRLVHELAHHKWVSVVIDWNAFKLHSLTIGIEHVPIYCLLPNFAFRI